jgi:hypothetical protein
MQSLTGNDPLPVGVTIKNDPASGRTTLRLSFGTLSVAVKQLIEVALANVPEESRSVISRHQRQQSRAPLTSVSSLKNIFKRMSSDVEGSMEIKFSCFRYAHRLFLVIMVQLQKMQSPENHMTQSFCSRAELRENIQNDWQCQVHVIIQEVKRELLPQRRQPSRRCKKDWTARQGC